MNTNFELFEGKSYNDLLKDIVTNTENKRDQIDIIITDLRSQIKTINDAIVLAPIIQSYIDISVKNDEQLVKLAAIVQRIISVTTESGDGTLLSEAEKEQLLKDIKDIKFNPVEVKKIDKK